MNSALPSVAACPAPSKDFDPFDLDDPFASYRELRARAPVFFDARIDYYIVSKYADIKATSPRIDRPKRFA